jgi:hypothetical protein
VFNSHRVILPESIVQAGQSYTASQADPDLLRQWHCSLPRVVSGSVN